jgi:uncharacterized protein YuzE
MKVMYHPDRDGLRILFSDAPIERSTSEVSGLIVDYDNNGVVVGLELTQASERMPNPRLVEFAEMPAHPDAADCSDED